MALFLVGISAAPLANSTSVAFAGVAYAGDYSSVDTRFVYSRRYERTLVAHGDDINARLRQSMAGRRYPFELNMASTVESKGDEILVTALTITGETISEEQFGSVHKLFVQIRAQALIFDFKGKKVRRAYPISFAYLDALDHAPSESEIDERVARAYEGAQGKPGILGRYADALASTSLPYPGELFLQITQVSIAPEAAPGIRPQDATTSGAAQSWLADHFGEALNTKAGVALLPYGQGYAIGNVMTVRLADTNYSLQIPPPDYEISVGLTGVKKVKYAENAIGTSYVYGSYATIRIAERGGSRAVLDAQFKNGEVKEVPASQTYVDDLPAYSDSIRGLFDKVAEELGGHDLPWLKTAASSPDVAKQITATRGLLKKCK